MSTHTNDDRSEGGDRLRVAVVGYGSLLQPAELATLSDRAPARAIPVKVDGLKRVFDQRTNRRRGRVRRRQRRSGGRFLDERRSAPGRRPARIRDVSGARTLVPVDRDPAGRRRTLHGSERPRVERQDLVLTTTGLETEAGIEPIPTYVDGCLDGAAEWGEEFREDFLATTKTDAGDRLTEYVD